jgi:hypothetical protein
MNRNFFIGGLELELQLTEESAAERLVADVGVAGSVEVFPDVIRLHRHVSIQEPIEAGGDG